MYVIIEGLDYSGKSTLISALVKALEEDGKEVLRIKEPSDHDERCLNIRKQLLGNHNLTKDEQTDLLLVQRNIVLNELVKPALAEGKIVISDRNFLTNVVYQSEGDNLDPLLKVNLGMHDAIGGVDISRVITLDVPHDEFIRRITAYGKYGKLDATETRLMNKTVYEQDQRKYAWAVAHLTHHYNDCKSISVSGLNIQEKHKIQFLKEFILEKDCVKPQTSEPLCPEAV